MQQDAGLVDEGAAQGDDLRQCIDHLLGPADPVVEAAQHPRLWGEFRCAAVFLQHDEAIAALDLAQAEAAVGAYTGQQDAHGEFAKGGGDAAQKRIERTVGVWLLFAVPDFEPEIRAAARTGGVRHDAHRFTARTDEDATAFHHHPGLDRQDRQIAAGAQRIRQLGRVGPVITRRDDEAVAETGGRGGEQADEGVGLPSRGANGDQEEWRVLPRIDGAGGRGIFARVGPACRHVPALSQVNVRCARRILPDPSRQDDGCALKCRAHRIALSTADFRAPASMPRFGM